jgi:hypothetical protein
MAYLSQKLEAVELGYIISDRLNLRSQAKQSCHLAYGASRAVPRCFHSSDGGINCLGCGLPVFDRKPPSFAAIAAKKGWGDISLETT